MYCGGKESRLQFFSRLIKDHLSWTLQGMHFRTTPEGGTYWTERPRKYEDLVITEKESPDADVVTPNIVLSMLPKDIYKLHPSPTLEQKAL
ncbi:hypothetical protein Tco_1318832 [Tanacetum coccineum]